MDSTDQLEKEYHILNSASICILIGILFAIGSSLFALGSVEGYILGRYTEGFEFFIGSLFFTAAALLQYLHLKKFYKRPNSSHDSSETTVSGVSPHIIHWALLLQILGTIFFNISTYTALKNNLMVTSIKNQVWSPDFYGSICFLLASGLLWYNMVSGVSTNKLRTSSWWMHTLNLFGSVAFVLSALMAFFIHKTGIPHQEILINLPTFLGSLCFLAGALLIIRNYQD